MSKPWNTRRKSIDSTELMDIVDQQSMESDVDGCEWSDSLNNRISLFEPNDSEITFHPEARLQVSGDFESDSDLSTDTTVELFNSARNSPENDQYVNCNLINNDHDNCVVKSIVISRPSSVATIIEEPRFVFSQGSGAANMAVGGDIQAHLGYCKRAALIWEDEFQALVPSTYGQSELSDAITQVKGLLEGLQEASLFFDSNPCDQFSDSDKNRLSSLRKAYGQMLRELRAAKKEPDIGAKIASNTIKAMRPTLTSTVIQLISDFKEIKKLSPTSTSSCRSMEATMAAAERDAEETLKQLESLRKEATTAQCGKTAGEIVEEIADLRENQRAARQHVRETQKRIGVLPGTHGGGATSMVNITAPEFTGDYTDGSLDFFTFSQKLDEYFEGAGVFSDSLKLVKLKCDCVKLPALNSIKDIKEYSVALNTLENLYGQAHILFSVKQTEVKKLGLCPEQCADRRTWLIDMKAALDGLNELANSQKVCKRFQSSDVLMIAENALRELDQVEFIERLFCKKKLNTALDFEDNHERMKELIAFFDVLIEKASFELRLKMARSRKDTKEVLSGMKKLDLNKKDKAHSKKAYNSARTTAHPSSSLFPASAHPPSSSDSSSEDEGGANPPPPPQPARAAPRAGNFSNNPRLVFCTSCNRNHTTSAYCNKYQKANNKDRFKLVVGTKACPRCLRLDAAFSMDNRESWFEKHKENCDDTFLCTLENCATKPGHMQNHITLCGKHSEQNKERETELLNSLNKKFLRKDAKFFFNGPGEAMFSHRTHTPPADHPFGKDVVVEPDVEDAAIYMLQYITGPENVKMLMFYDSGCYGAGLSDRGYSLLDTVCVRPGPTFMDVAGGQVIPVPNGDERLFVDLTCTGNQRHVATITALRMPEITTVFPLWPLQAAFDDLQKAYLTAGGQENLPTVEPEIGGMSVDILMGVKYNKYFPQLIFYLPCGLGIYKATFKGHNGHQGVLGGPHSSWTEALNGAQTMGPGTYLTAEMRAYRYHSNTLYHTVGVASDQRPAVAQSLGDLIDLDDGDHQVEAILEQAEGLNLTQPGMYNVSTEFRKMIKIDELGGDVEYRCSDCRNCSKCKKADVFEKMSLAEEREQALIESCVTFDPAAKQLTAQLPFTLEAREHLTDNFSIAQKVLNSQVRIAQKNPETIEQIIASHNKLRDKGYVMAIDDLPPDLKKYADQPGYYLPWRAVYSGSLSTPCRMVFDASARCNTGYSLNCILAKGSNMLATLLHLLIQFRVGASAFTADISMAYNQVKLEPEFLMFHKYLWKEDLKPDSETLKMVITTLIYGVRSSGNLTMTGFKLVAAAADQIAELAESGGPDCLRDSSYMDDVMSAFVNNLRRDLAADGLEGTLALGNMGVKAVTKSGQLPPEKVSADGQHVPLVGYLWAPEVDTIKLDIKPTALAKSKRGRPPPPIKTELREALSRKLTRRVLAGRVAGVFDPLGLATPFTAKLKLDLSIIISNTKGWDDLADQKYLDTWIDNLAETQQLAAIQVPRSLLSQFESMDGSAELIIATDASQYIAAAAVYLRVQVAPDKFKCLLMAAKSRIVSKLTVPRAELRACTLGACLGSVVKQNCKGLVTKTTFVSDSAVALSWLVTDTRPLQVGVRNQVIQVRRFSDLADWYHVPSADNPADIATRGADVSNIGAGSEWMNGKDWMQGPLSASPLRKVEDVVLQPADKTAVKSEVRNADLQGVVLLNHVSEISKRYSFSNYVVDPCERTWPKFIRKVALLTRMGRAAAGKSEPITLLNGRPIAVLTEEDYARAERYIFTTTTKEVRHFNKANKLKEGVLADGILRHTGRIMDGSCVDDPMGIFPDLQPMHFVKPMLDRFSPVAYSIMVYCHTTTTKHGGVVTTFRASLEVAYILKGKELAAEIRADCAYCQRFKVKQIEAVMGKIHQSRMTIAPAFYYCQVDLFGPIDAYCLHGRRAVLKAYGAVFKCSTTMAVAAFAMDKYDTSSFLDAFTRMASRYGLPKKLFIDAGSQLVAACKNTEFSIADITQSLNSNHQVQLEFEVCAVGSHEAHGSVERQIKEIKKVIHTTFKGLKFDFLKLETALAWISNELNCLPMCLGNKYTDIEHMDLITPARLLNGRNNGRTISAIPAAGQLNMRVEQIAEMEKAWWTVWKEEKIVTMIPQAKKWPTGNPEVKVGDVVVFLRDKNQLTGLSWRVGEIAATETSQDGVIRKVEIRYKNASGNPNDYSFGDTFRTTKRSVREIAVLWREGDLDVTGQLSAAQRAANIDAELSRGEISDPQ